MKKIRGSRSAPTVEARRRFVPRARQEGAIIEAAAGLFLESGYDGVSIDAITAVVGGSKRDIYGLFGSKEALFRVVIADLAAARATLVRDVHMEGDLNEALISIGVSILNILLAPQTLALHRLMVAEGCRVPGSAATFLENGPLAAYEAVEGLLNAHASGTRRDAADAHAQATVFVDALAGGLQLRALLGQNVDAREIDARARLVVARLFPES